MSSDTSIEWTDATWNPIGGCSRVSEGCRNCYAEIMAARFSGPGQWGEGLAQIVRDRDGKAIDHRWTGQLRFNDRAIDLPLRWRKPRRIFVNSTSDLFHENVPDEWIDKVFAVMALAPQHTFQVLTKRPERMRSYLQDFEQKHTGFRSAHRAMGAWVIYRRAEALASDLGRYGGTAFAAMLNERMPPNFHKLPDRWPLSNVWLGTSIEDQATADARIPHLLATPAAVRFVSAEPLLGPVHLDAITTADCGIYALTGVRSDGSGPSGFSQGHRLDWVIAGGESGPGARPMHPDWARSLRDQCQAADAAFFFKQWGEWFPGEIDNASDGRGWQASPDIDHDPRADDWEGRWKYRRFDDQGLLRVGKSRAGRLLDGREWNEMPGVRHG